MTLSSLLLHSMTNAAKERLSVYLAELPDFAIALSGGVDSLTLAWIAHETSSGRCQMVHAISPAVPPEATHLVKRYAELADWNLTIINADEYNDPRYKSNPVDRCYYCKTNLYTRIKEVTGRVIASGTNTDDLSDYRPGLQAAQQHNVVHPYVETGINKQTVRNLASACGLTEVASLPAQPCLASRVQTGIAIDANDLVFINTMENMLRKHLDTGDIRCRLTTEGVKIEFDKALVLATGEQHAATQLLSIEQMIKGYCIEANKRFRGIGPYSRGSAFLRQTNIRVEIA